MIDKVLINGSAYDRRYGLQLSVISVFDLPFANSEKAFARRTNGLLGFHSAVVSSDKTPYE